MAGKEIAIRIDDPWFVEELVLLRINKDRIFRLAIAANAPMDLMPEVVTVEEINELDAVFAELNTARDGMCAVAREIAAWKQELADARG